MRILANILWLIPFLGILQTVLFFVLGVLLLIPIITIPYGLGLIQYSKFLLAPFSRELVYKGEIQEYNRVVKSWNFLSNVIYFLIFSIPVAIYSIFIIAISPVFIVCTLGIGLIVLIPVYKSFKFLFCPAGVVCVSRYFADEMRREKAKMEMEKYRS